MRSCLLLAVAACNHSVPRMQIDDRSVGVGETYAFYATWSGPERVVDHPDCHRNRVFDCQVDLRFDRINFRLDLECDRPCARWTESSWDNAGFAMVATDRAGPLHVRALMIPHVRRPSIATYEVSVVDPSAVIAMCWTRSNALVDCAAPDAYELEIHGKVAGREYTAWGAHIAGVLRMPVDRRDRRYLVSELPHGDVELALGTARTRVTLHQPL